MSVELTFRRVDSVTVVMLSGAADEEFLLRVANDLAEARDDEALVVDVGEFLLTDANALRGFLAQLHDGSPNRRIALVCRRLSGRRLLRRWFGDEVPIVATVDDAADFLDAVEGSRLVLPV